MAVPCILAIDGALGGRDGNTAALLARMADVLADRASVATVSLADAPGFAAHAAALAAADAIVVGTGTYWDSWSSLLQRFLEEATPSEGTALWLGKPAAVLVTAHSVGGKGVLSRLQGVLSTLGCVIPPMSGVVIERATQAALAAADELDFWRPDDLEVVAHNVLTSLAGTRDYRAWEVDRGDPARRWLLP